MYTLLLQSTSFLKRSLYLLDPKTMPLSSFASHLLQKLKAMPSWVKKVLFPKFSRWLILNFAGLGVFMLFAKLREYFDSRQVNLFSHLLARVKSKIIDHVSIKPENVLSRREFQSNLKLVPVGMPKTHSHRNSAANRTTSSFAIDNLIENSGGSVYTVSMSARDQDKPGERLIYSLRDIGQPLRHDAILQNSVFKFVDVDYHADMHYYLRFGKPALLYTFSPAEAGGSYDEYVFSIKDDVVTYQVDGGATYIHKLWDYNHDFITVPTFTGVWVYAVEQYRLEPDKNRRIVGLFPTSFVPYPVALLMPRNDLKRLKMSNGSLNTIVNHVDGKLHVSISASGVPKSVTLPYDLYQAILVRLRESSWKNISDVERYLSQHKSASPSIDAALLFSATKDADPTVSTTVQVVGTSFRENEKANHYQTMAPLVTEDGKEYARKVSPPAVIEGEACCPVESFNNDNACVKGRILDVRNDKEPSSRFHKYADEFVHALIPEPNLGIPVSNAEVWEEQSRPSQRTRSEQARNWMGSDHFTVESFQKREPYVKPNDPRNISTCPTDHTIRLGAFNYGFKRQVMKTMGWYLPGLTPSEICQSVRRLADNSPDGIKETDQSRYDGRFSKFLRMVQDRCYLRWVSLDHLQELKSLLEREHLASARTKFGVKYNTGYSRLSGSSITTDGNTLGNAFYNYCCCREAGLSIEQSLDAEGVYYGCCGDDGVVNGVIPDSILLAVADELGLVIKLINHKKHEPVGLLGRIFVDPWTTTTTVQDPVRTLGKIHMSMSSEHNMPAHVAAYYKACSYLITDRLTPIIGSYCKCVELSTWDANADMLKHNYDFSQDKRYWVGDNLNSWPQNIDEFELMVEVIAKYLNLSASEVLNINRVYLDYANWLVSAPPGFRAFESGASRWVNFPSPMITLTAVPGLPVVMNGEVLEPPTVSDPSSVTKQVNEPQQRKPTNKKQQGQSTTRAAKGRRRRFNKKPAAPPKAAGGRRGSKPNNG